MHKDEKLKKLENKRSDLELAIADAKNQSQGGKDNPTVKAALEKPVGRVEEQISHSAARRAMMKFSDSNEAVKIKEYEGKTESTEKHRDSVAEQLKELKEQHSELTRNYGHDPRHGRTG